MGGALRLALVQPSRLKFLTGVVGDGLHWNGQARIIARFCSLYWVWPDLMLDVMRRSANSWVTKGLFLLLILSFGIWGVGDLIKGRRGHSYAIKVGDIEISPAEVQVRFQQRLNNLRQSFGDQITADLAKQMGMVDATVSEMARGATLDMVTRSQGIIASDDAVRARVMGNKAFAGENGAFSPSRYRSLLRDNNLSEASYEQTLRQDMARSRVVLPLEAVSAVPAPLVQAVARYEMETRSVDAAVVKASALAVKQTPDDAALQAVYQENSASLMAPETRTFSFLTLTPSAIVLASPPSEAELKAYWDENREQFSTPERRGVRHLAAPSEAAARDLVAAVKAGASLAEASKKMKLAAPVDLGAVKQSELPEEVATALFSVPLNGVSEPVQTPFGWQVFEVSQILPPEEKALPQVRDEVMQAVTAKKQNEQMETISAKIEDALGSGAGLEEVAREFHAQYGKVANSQSDGHDISGKAVVAGLPAGELGEALLKEAFNTDSGRDSKMILVGDVVALVRVEALSPAAPRSFDEVKDQVRTLWNGKMQEQKAAELAADLVAKVKAGASLTDAAKGLTGVTVSRYASLDRGGAQQADSSAGNLKARAPALTEEVAARVFALNKGDVEAVSTPDGMLVAQVQAIQTAAVPSAATAQGFAEALRKDMSDELMSEALHAWGKSFGVQIDSAAVQAAFQ